MPHVTVVTRNPAIAMGLTHHGYEVTDVRPDRHGDWARQALGSQAVVLELSDPIAADAAIRRLRDGGNGVPVLVVANDTAGWDQVVSHAGPGVSALPLPITLPSLTAAVENLVAEGPVAVPPPPRNEEELLTAVARRMGLTISDEGALVGEVPAHVREELDGDPAPLPDPEPVPLPDGDPAPLPDGDPALLPPPPPPVSPPPSSRAAAGMIAALTAAAGDLTGVAQAAEVVTAELAERVAAEATVLLLPDGDEWRVAGGVNLRPLERRARLTESDWLVRHVVGEAQGVVVNDTDGARDRLIGTPLASWGEVLAVPVEGVRGMFVAARNGAAFDEASLRAACAVAAEAAPLLREAMSVRVLARALAPYAELDD